MRVTTLSALFVSVLSACGVAHDGEAYVPGDGMPEDEIECEPNVGSQILRRGPLVMTDIPTDLAIDGEGFFVLARGNDRFFTRHGAFRIDDDYLIDENGLRVQGLRDGALTDIIVDRLAATPAWPTTRVEITANLSPDPSQPSAQWDANDPATTSVFSQNVSVYDSLGVEHHVLVYFTKTAVPNTWEYHVLANGAEIEGATDQAVEFASGTLGFTTIGLLDTEIPMSQSPFTFIGAEPQPAIVFDFGPSITTDGAVEVGTRYGTRQFGGQNYVVGVSQNGLPPGAVSGFAVTSLGVIEGIVTNGSRIPLAQLALAVFDTPEDLVLAFDATVIEGEGSGAAQIGVPAERGRGLIESEKLESVTLVQVCR